MAEDILGDRSNKFAYGYMRPGTIDPPEMEAEAAKPAPRVEPKRKEEELGLPPEEEEMLISAKVWDCTTVLQGGLFVSTGAECRVSELSGSEFIHSCRPCFPVPRMHQR